MRPRSKLLSQKRRLQLPTIREGYEDLVRDVNHFNSISQMNQTNTLRSARPAAHHELCPRSLSSDDYLLSICHLAHPTSLSTNDIINPPGQALTGVRLPQLPVHEGSPPTATALRRRKRFRESDTAESGMWSELLTVYRGRGKHSIHGEPSFGCLGPSDPLEFLYSSPAQSTCQSDSAKQGLGLRRQVAPRYAHSCSSDLRLQRESNCPEFSDTAPLDCDPSPSDLTQHPQQRGEHRVAEHQQAMTNSPLNKENQRCDDRAKERKEKRENDGARSTVEHSLISQWISDCRCAWKEASVRACILPSVTDS